ncbi:MAG TPA: hypothetical protein VJX68_17255 [Candidatus Binatus sp.]|uniref:hypothetical protein n=1 Tax=Candidatus Binatus sp. TaxID=2811406 RepID=UPI002B4888CA|nr:hypothetical protein [Candidatus Binatus sp.]HKN14939.1 hypothetical protein [Candidatus Binatus sp.]
MAVAVEVAVAVAVVVAVADAVAVAVGVKVAVAVGVRVGVGVGVGRLRFFAEPVSLTLADRSPAVASLLTLMLAEKLLPESGGANATVTVAVPCG